MFTGAPISEQPGSPHQPQNHAVSTGHTESPNEEGHEAASPGSPPVLDATADPSEEFKLRFVHVWFLFIITTGTFVLPMGLVILPYFTYSSKDNVSVTEFIISSSSSSHKSPVTRTTIDPWAAVPPECLQNVRLEDSLVHIHDSVPDNSGMISPTRRPFFCLFNNSRFRKYFGRDFIPEQFPFGLCPNIIYWSMAIMDGKVKSRTPNFDNKYGLWRLKNISDHRSNNQTKILMALGGYPQDEPHFRRLGRDPKVMGALVANIAEVVTQYRLDGIAIHWAWSEGNCEQPDDSLTLSSLLGNLKNVFQLNGLQTVLALMLPANKSLADRLVEPLASYIDFFFFDTHLVTPFPITFDMCGVRKNAAVNFLLSLRGYGSQQHKLCTSASITPMAVTFSGTHTSLSNPVYKRPSLVSRTEGKIAMFELCQLLTCNDSTTTSSSCIVRIGRSYYNLQSRRTEKDFYFFDNSRTINGMLHDGLIQGGGRFSQRCAVLYDIDFDNYFRRCGNVHGHNSMRFLVLNYFYGSAADPDYYDNIATLPYNC